MVFIEHFPLNIPSCTLVTKDALLSLHHYTHNVMVPNYDQMIDIFRILDFRREKKKENQGNDVI
jgi:hypothetical protein